MRIALNGWFWSQPHVGSGQYLHRLLEHLAAIAPEHEYHLVVPQGDAVAAPPDGVRLHAASLPFGPERPRPRKLHFEQVAFPRACRRLRADVAHVPYWGSPWFAPCPVVVTVHDLIPLLLPDYRAKGTMRWYIRLVSRTARRARRVIAVSQATADDVHRHLGISRARIRVVHEAAPPECRPVLDAARLDAVRQKYGLPPRFFFYLGGFDVRKNLPTLFSAFAFLLLNDYGPDVAGPHAPHLVVAGKLPPEDTPFQRDPRRLAEDLRMAGRVHCLGLVPEEDKPALYSLATALVFPSRFEGFGLPPLEAMACGCPVIAADNTSLTEVVGDGGILLPADDAVGMAGRMHALWTDADEWERWHWRGLARAAQFSWARAARETLAVYGEAVGSRE